MFLYNRPVGSTNRIPIRMFLSNESGYYLDISTYREVTDERTGQVGIKLCTHIRSENT